MLTRVARGLVVEDVSGGFDIQRPDRPLVGRVGAGFSDEAEAPKGAPNVVYVVLDDVGLGWCDTFGGLVETPNITRLADNGLRYTNFHTTALCSPTRSCLLNGRNHHSNGMANITELATGYPGYYARQPLDRAGAWG